MNVAVGRLHLAIYVDTAMQRALRAQEMPIEAENSVERAFRRERSHQAVEADRRHWAAIDPGQAFRRL